MANAITLARPNFIGPLNQHMDKVVGREIVTAFRIQADPVMALHHPLDMEVKRALLDATNYLTQSFERMVNTMHGQTEIRTDVLMPTLVEMLVNFMEYMVAFKAWREFEIPFALARMHGAVRLIREQYMGTAPDCPSGMNLLNDMLEIMNCIQLIESEYPHLVPRANQIQNNLIPY